MTIPYPQFAIEYNKFREIMTDGNNSIEFIDAAFGCLFTITNNTDPKDPQADAIQTAWEAISAEWPRRKELMMRCGHPYKRAPKVDGITRDKECQGRARISGTDMAVVQVLQCIEGGFNVKQIAKDYGLSEGQIKNAIQYATRCVQSLDPR